jgi:hypothetical protein
MYALHVDAHDHCQTAVVSKGLQDQTLQSTQLKAAACLQR